MLTSSQIESLANLAAEEMLQSLEADCQIHFCPLYRAALKSAFAILWTEGFGKGALEVEEIIHRGLGSISLRSSQSTTKATPLPPTGRIDS